MGDFRRLAVWQQAHAVAVAVYRVSAGWPPEERFGLTSQVRRAAVSVPSNIAEGTGRLSDRELCRFLRIARGSNQELLAQLLLAASLGFPSGPAHAQLVRDVGRVGAMLSTMLERMGRTS
jgi:four helix bundle protein